MSRGSTSCLLKAHSPTADAPCNPSASTSTEWRMPFKSINDTIQAAMTRRIAFSGIFANRTLCHLRNELWSSHLNMFDGVSHPLEVLASHARSLDLVEGFQLLLGVVSCSRHPSYVFPNPTTKNS